MIKIEGNFPKDEPSSVKTVGSRAKQMLMPELKNPKKILRFCYLKKKILKTVKTKPRQIDN